MAKKAKAKKRAPRPWFQTKRRGKTPIQKQINVVAREVNPRLSTSTSTVVNSVSVSTSTAVSSLSGSTSTAVNSLSGSTSSVVTSVSGTVSSLSGSTSTVVNSLSGSTSTVVNSLSGSTSTVVNSLSGSTSTVVDSTSTVVNSLSGSTSTVVDSVSGAVNSLSGSTSTVVNSLSGSTSTVVNSLSGSTSSALDLNQLYSDQNQIFGAAAQFEVLGNLGLVNNTDGGVLVQGGTAPDGDNVAYAGRVNTANGEFTPAFGIEYTGSTLYGYSPDPDFVQSTRIDATIYGGGAAANWTMLGGTGDDSLYGGGLNDYIVGDRSATPGYTYYQGQDTIVGNGGNNTIYGDSIGDISFGNADSIVGGGNGDTIYGGGGNDTILTGDGNNGDNLVYGQDGNDSIVGGVGNDDIYGGNGDDTIVGSLGADSLFGGDGNDLFIFGNTSGNTDLTTSATVEGDAGTNTLSFVEPATTVTDTAFTYVSNIDVLTTANGLGSTLSLNGFASDAGVSTVQGGNGDDTFNLGSNFDTAVTLLGGAGNDDFTLNNYGQVTLGYIDGGVGTNDTLEIVTSLGSSSGPTYAGIVSSKVANIERLQLGETATNYVNLGDANGDWGIASVYGGANVDNFINAAAVNVSINLFGGNNGDQLIAGSNGDVIQGWLNTTNTSSDTLTGGVGNDDFVLGNNTDNAYGQSGAGSPIAYIRDFDAGSDDLIVKNFGGGAGDYNSASVGVPVGYNTRLFRNSSNTDTIAFLNVTSGVFNTGTDLNLV